MSYTVIHSNSNSAGSATNPTDFADFTATTIAVSISGLVPNSIDVLLSLALLTSAVLYFLDLGSSAHLLLIYLFYFPNPFFFNKVVLAFLTYLAILRILYKPVKM